MIQSHFDEQWRIGMDVVVTDATSDYFGFVGSVVRIINREKNTRCSVSFDGDVQGFEKSELQIATL